MTELHPNKIIFFNNFIDNSVQVYCLKCLFTLEEYIDLYFKIENRLLQ